MIFPGSFWVCLLPEVQSDFCLKFSFVLIVGYLGVLHLFHCQSLQHPPLTHLTFPGVHLLVSQSGLAERAQTLICGDLCSASFAQYTQVSKLLSYSPTLSASPYVIKAMDTSTSFSNFNSSFNFLTQVSASRQA